MFVKSASVSVSSTNWMYSSHHKFFFLKKRLRTGKVTCSESWLGTTSKRLWHGWGRPWEASGESYMKKWTKKVKKLSTSLLVVEDDAHLSGQPWTASERRWWSLERMLLWLGCCRITADLNSWPLRNRVFEAISSSFKFSLFHTHTSQPHLYDPHTP